MLLIIPIIGFTETEPVLKGYDEITIPKGTFIPVFNMQEFSTRYCDDTTIVKFIVPEDMFMFESVIIPKGSVFWGYIAKMNEPIIGTNASMIVAINKMQYPDGFQVPVKGYIYTPNNNLMGGGLTAPEKYIKTPHYQKGLGKGTLQWVPGPTRKMGGHLTVAAGTPFHVVLVAPMFITHTLTN